MSNDNTKVNELGQQILDAIDIIALSRLNSISFDKTITCTIINDEKRKEGEYEVSDGSVKFKAYSTDDGHRKDDVVYVTIPQGDYNNQKLIVSKKTDDIVQPMIFKMPFDNIFDMTGNLAAVDGQSLQTGMLLANDVQVNAEGEVVLENDLPKKIQGGTTVHLGTLTPPNASNFTRFGVRADFKTWLAEAIEGTYGLKFEVTTETKGVVSSTNSGSQITNTSKEEFYFTNISDMYGNTYNYESYYSQEKVFTLTNQGKITKIDVYFFQLGDFKDKNKQDIKATDSFNSRLWENIYVDNLYLCLGYDIAVFNDDYVEIYTENSSDYARSTDTADTEDSINDRNTKKIKMRWVHINDDGNPVDMSMSEVEEIDKPTEIRWYRYRIGAAAADNYSGVYWERINSASGMSYDFIPDMNNQQERIKAVVLYNIEKDETTNTLTSGIPYHSNELEFTNQETLPPGKTAQHVANALQIITNDGSNGNYLIYGQDNSIKDTKYGDEIRTLSCVFDTNNDGKYESEVESVNLTWHFPTSNTMIEFVNGGVSYTPINLIAFNMTEVYEKDNNNENKYNLTNDTEFILNKTYYKKIDENNYEEIHNPYIKNIYYKQNYIQAASYDNKRIYYERSGTSEPYSYMQSDEIDISNFTNYYILDYILSTDYNSNDKYFKREQSNSTITGRPQYKIKKYYSPNYTNNTITCQYNLNGVTYNSEIEFTFGPSGTMGTDQTLVIDFDGDANAIVHGDKTAKFILRVYNNQNKDISADIDYEQIQWYWYRYENGKIIEQSINGEKADNTLTISYSGNVSFNINTLYILKASLGPLSTYFPIPVKKEGKYSHIQGASQVIYLSNGEPSYNRSKYQLFTNGGTVPEGNITWYLINSDTSSKYVGNINQDGTFTPLGVFVEDAPIYGVQAKDANENILWTQPILVLQNKWGNNVLNEWDGKKLEINEGQGLIISNAIAAGKKETTQGDYYNTFSGVIMGDWSDLNASKDQTQHTGVYGFHHGAMSYAFKEDGTAFIGKSGMGRIELDGNQATLQSSGYSTGKGLKIDMGGEDGIASIDFKYKNNNKNYFIKLNSGATSTPLQIGTGSTPAFSVNWDGYLYAADAHLEGTITGSTLKANNDAIELQGAMQIQLDKYENKQYYGYFGELNSNLYTDNSDQQEAPGIGLYITDSSSANSSESNKLSGIKATAANTGLFYSGGGYLSIDSDGLSIGSESLNLYCSDSSTSDSKIVLDVNHVGMWSDGAGHITVGTDTDNDIYITRDGNGSMKFTTNSIQIDGQADESVHLWVNNIPAKNQHGIYARFA